MWLRIAVSVALACGSVVAQEVPLKDWAVPFEQIRGKVAETQPLRIAERSLHPSVNAVPSAASHFITIVPCRIVDTRLANGSYGSPKLVGGASRTFNIPGGPCTGIPTSAAAYSLNFTVLNGEGSSGFLTAYPTGSTRPTVSTLNFGVGNLVANAAIVPGGTSASIDVYVNYNVDIIIDINGYFAEGVVTSLTAGTGMTGGGTGNVTLGLANSGVTATQLAGNSVSTGTIQDNAVTATKIANGQVVKSIKGLTDAVDITGTNGATVTTSGNAVQISATPLPSGSVVLSLGNDTNLINAGYTEFASTEQQLWRSTSAAGAPTARYWNTVVWTGTRMIIWGGRNNSAVSENTGAQYDPATDTWTPTTTASAAAARQLHVAVWTGSKMIVWGGETAGGYSNTGGQYDPITNSWSATSTTAAPGVRINHAAVWTGTYMIVWGGYNVGAVNTGGRYRPVQDDWQSVSTTNAPSARDLESAIWTGGYMVIWGGREAVAGPFVNTGGRYDPAADTWTPTSTSGAPTGRWGHSAVWTGNKMIVWGGETISGSDNTGGQYDPSGDVWTATTTTGAPSARYLHIAVWTTNRMIVWGGGITYENTGSIYDPPADTWSSLVSTGAPAGRYYHSAVWTGSRMIVWGGLGSSGVLSSGGQWGMLSYYRKN